MPEPSTLLKACPARRVPASDPRRFGWVLKRLGKDVLYYEEVETGHWETQKSQLIRDYTYFYVFIQEHIMPVRSKE